MKRKRIIRLMVLIVVLSLCSGCKKNDASETKASEESQQTASEAAESKKSSDEFAFISTTVTDEQPVDSSVFSQYKLTAVNIWATWCNPCVGELAELQKLYEALPEGVNFMGICTDAETDLELAQQILESKGVKYTNIAANQEMMQGILSTVNAYPTTLFIDQKGNIVGNSLVGAPSSDVVNTYLTAIQEHLSLLEE